MKKKISEKIIIKKFFNKLNNNKLGTFNFENDAAYFNISKNYKTIITTDTITEDVDFFQHDPPESIAQKLVCVNLSDLSAMGALPKAYTLNLSITPEINLNWLRRFTSQLSRLQKKYNIYLIGGDISKSKEISLSATFIGQAKLKFIISQNKCCLNDDIWITGNLGNSYLGYKILTNQKLKISKKKYKDFFKKCYFYPEPCMFGNVISGYINSAIDISDGFYGDLNKILNGKYGAKIYKKNIPILDNLKKIILDNSSKINIENILSWGDDYELIFTSNKSFKNRITNLAKKNNIKLSHIGSVIRTKGIFDDSMSLIKNPSSYDHFF